MLPHLCAGLLLLAQAAPASGPSPSPSPTPVASPSPPAVPQRLRLDIARHVDSVLREQDGTPRFETSLEVVGRPPDIALEEAIHRSLCGHIGRDFENRSPLAVGPLKWEQPLDPRMNIGRDLDARRAETGGLLVPPSDHCQLKYKQLLKDKPPLGAGQLLGVFRRVDRRKCFGQRHQLVLRQQSVGKDFFEKACVLLGGSTDHPPHLVLI